MVDILWLKWISVEMFYIYSNLELLFRWSNLFSIDVTELFGASQNRYHTNQDIIIICAFDCEQKLHAVNSDAKPTQTIQFSLIYKYIWNLDILTNLIIGNPDLTIINQLIFSNWPQLDMETVKSLKKLFYKSKRLKKNKYWLNGHFNFPTFKRSIN